MSPINKNKASVHSQSSLLKGVKKIHMFLFSALTGTIIDTPDSVYGSVKSTYFDLLAMIVVSPTTASNF